MAVDIVRAAEQMDRTISRSERDTVQAIRRYLNESHRRLQAELRELYQQAAADVVNEGRVFREARARQLLAQLDTALDSIRLGNPGTGVPRIMQDVIILGQREGPQQVAELVAQLETQGTALGLSASVNLAAIEAQAANAAQRLTRYSNEAIDKINQAVIDGLARGRGVREVQREVSKAILAPDALRPGERIPRGRPGGLAFRAETIARTELISSLESAREDAMREAEIELAMWVATESEATCEWCASRDGQVYKLSDIILPAHPRCKCVTSPVRREWLADGTIDTTAVEKHQRDTRRIFEEAHGKEARYATGPSAFEKAAGMTSKPKAVWTPAGGFQ